jgi:hypothetical protein
LPEINRGKPLINLAKIQLSESSRKKLDSLASLAFIVLIAFSIYHLYSLNTPESRLQREAYVTANISKSFAELNELHEYYEPLKPATRWLGRDAKLLHIEKFSDDLFFVKKTKWNILAQTPAGNFFTAQYLSEYHFADFYISANCDKNLSCVKFKAVYPLSRAQAKEELFRAGKRDSFKEIFNEEAPPVEIKG